MTLARRINGLTRHVPAWPIYLAAVGLPAWYFWLGLNGGLGVEPIAAFEHLLGVRALQFLIATLAITPLRRLTGVNLIKYRRALGLTAFYLVVAHLAVWLFLDVQNLRLIVTDIVKRPYITVGMVGLLLLLPVALTSNDGSIRRLGAAAWRRVHWLTYPAVVLGAVHFVMLRKGWQIEPLVYLAVVLGLLLLRVKWGRIAARAASARPGGA